MTSMILLIALLNVGAAAAEPATRPAEPVTLEFLRAAKTSPAQDMYAAGRALAVRLDGDPVGTEKASLEFLREEAAAQSPQPGQPLFYVELIRRLGDSGHETAVPVLVACMGSSNPGMSTMRTLSADALIRLSARVPVSKEQLASLLTGSDKELAELAQAAWKYIEYKDVPEPPDKIVAAYRSIKSGLEKACGTVFDFSTIARERNLSRSDDRGTVIRSFITNCEKRRDLPRPRPDPTSWPAGVSADILVMAESREKLAELAAVEELAQTQRGDAFDDLVNLLENSSDEAIRTAAAYHLLRMTDQHFPIAGRLPLKMGGMPIDLHKKAAAAWRTWRASVGKELPKPDPAALSLQDRLAAFRMTQLTGAGGEFARPADEVISELIAQDSRPVIEMLSEVLRRKTLTEAQVSRLIEAVGKEPSTAKRLYLWQVLISAQSPAARDYLVKALAAGTDERPVVEFVHSLVALPAFDMTLLTDLYGQTASPLVRDAIVEFACRQRGLEMRSLGGPDREAVMGQARRTVLQWLTDHSKTDEHRFQAFSAAYATWPTDASAQTFLDSTSDPALRKRFYEFIMSRGVGDRWLGRVLSDETEDVQVEGVRAYRRYLDQAVTNRGWTDSQAPPAALRSAVARPLPPEVLKEVRACLDHLRRAAEDNLVAGFRERDTYISKSIPRQHIQQMLDQLDRQMDVEGAVSQLKSRFGPLPDEAELRKRLQEAKDQYRDRLQKLMEQSK